MTDGAGVTCPIERDVVRVSGPEALTYLQGQLSQDVAGLAVGDSAQSMLLEPTGKLGLVLRVTKRAEDDLVLDTTAGWGERLIERLHRFKLRTKADIEAVEHRHLLSVRGANANGPGFDSGWPTWPGRDLLDGDAPADDATRDAWERSRILAGVPELGRELEEGMIPAEGGQLLIDATVSFTKGCYTGQELVARVDSRGGNAPRRLVGLEVAGEQVPPVGAAFAERGRLTSVVGGEGGIVGLALAPRAVELGGTVELTWEGGSAAARVVGLPFGS